MNGISYLVLVEYPTAKHHRFFTSKRARTESPKALQSAEEWASQTLREHGTHNVRCSVAKVLWSITG